MFTNLTSILEKEVILIDWITDPVAVAEVCALCVLLVSFVSFSIFYKFYFSPVYIYIFMLYFCVVYWSYIA